MFSCEGLACSEIRAAREAECERFSKPFFSSFKFISNQCIKYYAKRSTKNIFPSEGEKCVNKIYDHAINDKEPT